MDTKLMTLSRVLGVTLHPVGDVIHTLSLRAELVKILYFISRVRKARVPFVHLEDSNRARQRVSQRANHTQLPLMFDTLSAPRHPLQEFRNSDIAHDDIWCVASLYIDELVQKRNDVAAEPAKFCSKQESGTLPLFLQARFITSLLHSGNPYRSENCANTADGLDPSGKRLATNWIGFETHPQLHSADPSSHYQDNHERLLYPKRHEFPRSFLGNRITLESNQNPRWIHCIEGDRSPIDENRREVD